MSRLTNQTIFHITLRACVTLTLVLVSGCRPLPSAAPQIHMHAAAAPLQRPQFTVSGEAQLDVAPDCADVTMVLSAEASRGAAAQASVATQEASLRAGLVVLGISPADIVLGPAGMTPTVEYDKYGKVIRRGFRSHRRMIITTRDFSRLGQILEVGANGGIGDMSTTFRKEKLSELKASVRTMALEAAKTKAKQISDALGVGLGPVVGITEERQGAMWSPGYVQRVPNVSESIAAGPQVLSAESQRISLTVSVTYELVAPR